MRQIDNMTPQEIETLHLKGMLADKPQTAILYCHTCDMDRKHNRFSTGLECQVCGAQPLPNLAPNKAQPQHSPLPWRTVVETEFEPCAICDTDGNEMVHLAGGSSRERATNAKLIVRAVNHADKLAARLKDAIEQSRFIYGKTVSDNQNLCKLQREMQATLTEYENER